MSKNSGLLQQQPLILASGSAIRAKLLNSLGLQFLILPSHCDEETIKLDHQSQQSSSAEFNTNFFVDLGSALAGAKALEVSQHYPEHFVIAADQLCVINNQILDKPLTHQKAIEHLQLLRGTKHQQMACVCIAKNNKILWQYHDIANLLVRDLTSNEIEAYLRCEEPYQSCGAYQYESLGRWLFKEVEGNEDTILGLPLLPLANALVDLGAVQL